MKDNWLIKDNTKQDYLDVCKRAVKDDLIFVVFKSFPKYIEILEHVDYALGKEYYNWIIQKGVFTLEELVQFKQNDRIGSPILQSYNELIISPTTLRYIKVLIDLINNFKPHEFKNWNIVEIGGGYGGQCWVINQGLGFNTYTIYDLQEVCNLQSKYLEKLNVYNVFFKSLIEKPKDVNYKIDLVISNYAWCEFDKVLRKQYLDHVITKSKHGYLTLGVGSKEKREELLSELFESITTFKVIDDIVIKEKFKYNCIVIW
jgi:hypothetical protein